MKRIMMLTLLVLALAAPALAQQPDWRAKERQCMAGCPAMPRYAGIETDEEYWARMQAQAAHDACKMRCAAESAQQYSKSYTPISQAAADYYKRNGY